MSVWAYIRTTWRNVVECAANYSNVSNSMVYLAYAFMLSLESQLYVFIIDYIIVSVVGEGYEMYSDNSPSKPTEGSSESVASSKPIYNRPVEAALKNHRKMAAIVTLSVLATAIVIPYSVRASINTSSEANSKNSNLNVHATSESKSMVQPQDSTQHIQQPKAAPSGDTNSNASKTTVTVNGQTIEVPANGIYDKTTTDGNGQTQVQVNSSHHRQGAAVWTKDQRRPA